MLAAAVLHIRVRYHRLHRRKLNARALNRNHRRALLRRTPLQLGLRLAADRVVVSLQERHALKRETDRTRPVHWGWDTALKRVSQRSHPRIEQRRAFFLQHFLDKVRGEDGRGRLISR